jgi:hypothetical protein
LTGCRGGVTLVGVQAPPRSRRFIDQSFGKLTPQQIKDEGWFGAMGYVSLDPKKNMTRAFVDGCQALGLEVYVVWQEGKSEALGGAARGRYVGPEARRQVRALGLADSCPIRFANDNDTPLSQRATLEAYYLAAEQSELQVSQRVGRTRAYGKDAVLNWLVQVGIPGDWQCAAWSGATNLDGQTYNGRLSAFAGALQMPQELTRYGVWVDQNWLIDSRQFPGARQAQLLEDAARASRKPRVVSVVTTPSGYGYWECSDDGGVYTYGDAQFFGSLGGLPLVKPVVSLVRTPTGLGYWMVAADGGVFAFGDAPFVGSLAGLQLAAPIGSATASPTGKGLILVGLDGGVFCRGDATYQGSVNADLERVYGPLVLA